MNNTEKITIFRQNNPCDEWNASSYNASIYFVNSVKSESGGITDNNIVKIRIPSDKPLDIIPGDRIMLKDSNQFTYENSFFISEVSNNLKGKNKHIRLLCR